MATQMDRRVRDAWDRLVVAGLAAVVRLLTRVTDGLIKERTGAGGVCELREAPECRRHRPPIGVLDIDTHLRQLIEFSERARVQIEREELEEHVVGEIEAISENVIASCYWIVAHYGGPVGR